MQIATSIVSVLTPDEVHQAFQLYPDVYGLQRGRGEFFAVLRCARHAKSCFCGTDHRRGGLIVARVPDVVRVQWRPVGMRGQLISDLVCA